MRSKAFFGPVAELELSESTTKKTTKASKCSGPDVH